MDWGRLNPRFWLQNYPTSAEWDTVISAALDSGDVKITGPHTAHIGRYEVWVANYPYAFGYRANCPCPVLPKTATRRRIYNFVGLLAK